MQQIGYGPRGGEGYGLHRRRWPCVRQIGRPVGHPSFRVEGAPDIWLDPLQASFCDVSELKRHDDGLIGPDQLQNPGEPPIEETGPESLGNVMAEPEVFQVQYYGSKAGFLYWVEQGRRLASAGEAVARNNLPVQHGLQGHYGSLGSRAGQARAAAVGGCNLAFLISWLRQGSDRS